jgi:hypothetical protein
MMMQHGLDQEVYAKGRPGVGKHSVLNDGKTGAIVAISGYGHFEDWKP